MLVPPFYGPLFVDIMPPRSMARLLEIRNPALCPHLPALYWDLVLGGEGTPVIPFTRALPFSCSMRTFRRRGWRRRDLHLTAVRMGINAVEPGLAARMRAWYDAQPRMRVDRESMVSGAIPPPVASPGIDRGSAENGP